MKKLIASLAIAAATAGLSAQDTATSTTTTATGTGTSISDLSVSGTFDYESAYVYRGKQLAQESFQPNLELSFPVQAGDLYAGLWMNSPLNNNQYEEVDFYLGFIYPVMDELSIDAGFMYYWYSANDTVTNAYATVNRSREIYVGVNADVMFSPALYIFYNFDLDQVVLEGSVGYSFDLSDSTGIQGLSFDTGAYLGWLSAGQYNGNQRDGSSNHISMRSLNGEKWKNSYAYGGIVADLTYAFSENLSSSIGLRWSTNNDGSGNDGLNGVNLGADSNLWFGSTVGFSY